MEVIDRIVVGESATAFAELDLFDLINEMQASLRFLQYFKSDVLVSAQPVILYK